VIVGLIFGIGAWQRHKTETSLTDQSSSFVLPTTPTPPTATVDLPESLPTR
jgi:hypothetical protein